MPCSLHCLIFCLQSLSFFSLSHSGNSSTKLFRHPFLSVDVLHSLNLALHILNVSVSLMHSSTSSSHSSSLTPVFMQRRMNFCGLSSFCKSRMIVSLAAARA
ncbi:unnamed protein product [Pseudo-nitzschia multistriata]|uniref:Secreted protein n=1 Tax=Pseudo-nitzschia multistriata TaxID=183589 RepID=A0A448YWZ4_9STRA|nr:unnamed protein product [Pseudo-nitzschia multistriata]